MKPAEGTGSSLPNDKRLQKPTALIENFSFCEAADQTIPNQSWIGRRVLGL